MHGDASRHEMCLTRLRATGRTEGCGEGICHDYGDEPRFDESERPPNAVVLGRATWTVMHTTAAYLPDELTPVEAKAFRTLMHSMPMHYPGKGRALISKVFTDETIQKELGSVETKEQAMLFTWKGKPSFVLIQK